MRTSLFRSQKRNGKGVIAIKFKRDDDRLVALKAFDPGAEDEQELLLITAKGTIVRQRLSAISEQQRATTGVLIQRLDEDDEVASVAIVDTAEGEGEEGEVIDAEAEGETPADA